MTTITQPDAFDAWCADEGMPATELIDGREAIVPNVDDVVANITGDTPLAVDRAFKTAWETLTPAGARRPDRDIEARLREQHRRAHDALITRHGRKPAGQRPPKGEFPPIAMRTLAWFAAQQPVCGPERGGFSVNEITAGMGEKYSGTVWHAVRRLVDARRVRPMPDDAKRFSLFPPVIPADGPSTPPPPRPSGDVREESATFYGEHGPGPSATAEHSIQVDGISVLVRQCGYCWAEYHETKPQRGYFCSPECQRRNTAWNAWIRDTNHAGISGDVNRPVRTAPLPPAGVTLIAAVQRSAAPELLAA